MSTEIPGFFAKCVAKNGLFPLLRIDQLFHRPAVQNTGVKRAALPRQRHVQVDIISTFAGGLAGHGAFPRRALCEHLPQQVDGLRVGELSAVKQEVEARLAAHGTEVDDGILLLAVAQGGGDDVLHRVHLGVGQQVAGVGPLEAQVKGGDAAVPAAEIQPRRQHVVVHGKACDTFHGSVLQMIHQGHDGGVQIPHGGGEIKVIVVLAGQAVGHGFQRHKGYAAAIAYLGHGAALHLTQQRMEGVPHPVGTITGDAEPVAGGHGAGAVGIAGLVHGGPGLFKISGGEVHPIDGGDQSDGVAHAGGVHVVLDKFFRQHQRADGNLIKAARHTGVEDQIHAVFQAQDLRRHGGIHLADTAGAGNDPRCSLVERHTGHGLKCLQLLGPRQGMKLRRHGKLQSNFHYITLLFTVSSGFLQIQTLVPEGYF